MADIWHRLQKVIQPGLRADFDFSSCGFLQPNAVAFLGAIAEHLNRNGCDACFLTGTMLSDVRMNLLQNGFAYAMGAATEPWPGNSIPYRCYPEQDKYAVADYLRSGWLGRGWLNVSPVLAARLVGEMWEIFANAFEHSGSAVGVHTCGQFFHRKRELTLAVADLGCGIPARVREYLGSPAMPGRDCLQWAFTPGNSTDRNLVPRGMGLHLLRQLIRETQGLLLVYSGDACVRIDRYGDRYQNVCPSFPGTLVQVRLNCDDRRYVLSSEVPTGPPAPFF